MSDCPSNGGRVDVGVCKDFLKFRRWKSCKEFGWALQQSYLAGNGNVFFCQRSWSWLRSQWENHFVIRFKISISQGFTNMSNVNQFHKIAIMSMFQTFVNNVACQPIPTCQQFSELGGCQRFTAIFRMRLWVDDWWEPTNGNPKHGSDNNWLQFLNLLFLVVWWMENLWQACSMPGKINAGYRSKDVRFDQGIFSSRHGAGRFVPGTCVQLSGRIRIPKIQPKKLTRGPSRCWAQMCTRCVLNLCDHHFVPQIGSTQWCTCTCSVLNPYDTHFVPYIGGIQWCTYTGSILSEMCDNHSVPHIGSIQWRMCTCCLQIVWRPFCAAHWIGNTQWRRCTWSAWKKKCGGIQWWTCTCSVFKLLCNHFVPYIGSTQLFSCTGSVFKTVYRALEAPSGAHARRRSTKLRALSLCVQCQRPSTIWSLPLFVGALCYAFPLTFALRFVLCLCFRVMDISVYGACKHLVCLWKFLSYLGS